MAHKKAGSSSKNGRDSAGQRLGVKRGDGQADQRRHDHRPAAGSTFHPGANVGMGRDYTLFATADGKVKFSHETRSQEARERRHPPTPRSPESMKAEIHPQYYQAQVHCVGCGTTFTVGSTAESIRVEVCANCHPFYTGTQNIVDTAGQVERFQRRMERAKR